MSSGKSFCNHKTSSKQRQRETQLTLEHRFELHRSTYNVDFFFSSKYYTTCSWLNPQMWRNRVYGGQTPSYMWIFDFGGSAPLISMLFKGQLYNISSQALNVLCFVLFWFGFFWGGDRGGRRNIFVLKDKNMLRSRI